MEIKCKKIDKNLWAYRGYFIERNCSSVFQWYVWDNQGFCYDAFHSRELAMKYIDTKYEASN